MKSCAHALFIIGFGASIAHGAGDDDYKPGPDSLPQPGVTKGEMLKDKYIAAENSVFPGTEREYQIYLPAGLDTSKPAPFMVFQDGVIYQAPVVFDNLIAKKEIPPLIGIFIKPGVVPAANDNALPRFNRSYEYDSVTDNYSRFLIDEFLPAIKARHKLNLSDDPNARGIAGSSSGGICAFMVAWHRPDSFRRVFTSVGTYVGIHGADQLPVLVRKFEPKPIRIHLQSGENDNNLYCGDWWMANQMMERSLTWNGYDVNHTWGTGGHNQKHATAIFPDVLRWLWKGYPDEPVKANPRGDAKWRGYEVILAGDGWVDIPCPWQTDDDFPFDASGGRHLSATASGDVIALYGYSAWKLEATNKLVRMPSIRNPMSLAAGPNGSIFYLPRRGYQQGQEIRRIDADLKTEEIFTKWIEPASEIVVMHNGVAFCTSKDSNFLSSLRSGTAKRVGPSFDEDRLEMRPKPYPKRLAFSPDQTQLYATDRFSAYVAAYAVSPSGTLDYCQKFCQLDKADLVGGELAPGGLCVDTNGWLYVATSLGIQVLDQCGRVNFIIPTPKQPYDVCFGGKDLSELFIACGDTIYKRQTKAHGYISGQMAPIKPAPPKL